VALIFEDRKKLRHMEFFALKKKQDKVRKEKTFLNFELLPVPVWPCLFKVLKNVHSSAVY
jgi:hypothetical protein